VVRHPLVQRVVRAYESAKPRQQELPLTMGDGIQVGAQESEERAEGQAKQTAKPQ
jgi:phosphate starvation-inducible PhoH-like protein